MINFSSRGSARRPIAWAAAGTAALVATAATLLTLTGVAGAGKHRIAAADQFLKAISAPLKLRAPEDPPEVRFDISCLPPDGDAEKAGVCDGGGTVYFHSNGNGWTGVPLRVDPSVQVGRYVAAVPARIWAAPWFTYYAVIRDNTTGSSIVVPQGGSGSPQLSLATDGSGVELGTHVFGQTRAASARVASASWGDGAGQIGLEHGVDMPTGAASFDVDAGRTVYLLDEAHARMLVYEGAAAPAAIPLPGLAGVRADLRVSDSADTAYVLEVANSTFARPMLRAYTLRGDELAATPIADAAAAQIRLSGSTAFVSEYPSSMWAPALQNNGLRPVDPAAQLARGSAGAPSRDGNVVVLSTGSEIRVGSYSVAGTSYAFSTVRLRSATPVADIQLAQTLPSGRLVVVFSVYTDTDHEYEAAVIDPSGVLVDQFSLPAEEWAQSMPLSRFRLVGTSLYELGSTADGAFVDRYDLEVS